LIPHSVKQVVKRENAVFALYSDGIARFDLQSSELLIHPCVTDNKFLLPQNEFDFLLCSPQKAELYTFTKQ